MTFKIHLQGAPGRASYPPREAQRHALGLVGQERQGAVHGKRSQPQRGERRGFRRHRREPGHG